MRFALPSHTSSPVVFFSAEVAWSYTDLKFFKKIIFIYMYICMYIYVCMCVCVQVPV